MQIQQLGAHLDTLCVGAGTGHGDGAPLALALVQSTAFCRDGLASSAVHRYSRESNPTVAALERALGDLEGAPPAVAFATGLAAETALFLSLLRSGDHVVCSRAMYGGTTRLLHQVLAPLGIASTAVDTTRPAEVRAALRPSTKLVFVETPANPTLDLTDVRAVAEIARAAGVPLAVDNTFLTPVLQQPLELGADFSVYSTTKLIEGHSVALGGAVVGRDAAALEHLRFLRKCTGAIQTPFGAWLTLLGLKTLPVRLRRQSASAETIARWLAAHPAVARVCYPTLAGPAARRLAAAQHRGAHGAVVSFELAGGAAAAQELLRRVRRVRLVEHVGGVETLLTHPATMTHGGIGAEERAQSGVTDGLLRLSVGLEHPDDVVADLAQASAAPAPAEIGGRPCRL
jgi:cystathionine beta-lyase/cystathionine gamma-synthase